MILKSEPLCLLKRAVRLSKDCRELSPMSKMQSNLSEPQVLLGRITSKRMKRLGRRDFVMKIKICRREAKESCYWLRLLDVGGELEQERQQLSTEAKELMNIFGAILRKCE